LIKSFKCKKTQKLFDLRIADQKFRSFASQALRKLAMLSYADKLVDLRIPPANKLVTLTGKRKGQYSIRINRQYRICFEWKNGNAYDVEIIDYH